MEREILNIVIVGHIDHGKSTLIGRLLIDTDSLPKDKFKEVKKVSRQLGREAELAYLADQLKEERERNITIDTTQIFFKTPKRDYVIIDTPGHPEFIKNMLTGAAQAECAILIIDVGEGIMEQTRRHAYLINMLGINKIIIVFNKMDLVDYQKERFENIKEELSNFLQTLQLNPSYFIPVSAKEGVNISQGSYKLSWYKGPHLLKALESLAKDIKIKGRPLRFPVQDVYRIGSENLVVGRIESGRIRQNQKVMILPQGLSGIVNKIKIFQRIKCCAREGESIGIILNKNTFIKRGMVISQQEDAPSIINRFKGHIFCMSAEPLEINKKAILRCATQEVGCSIEKIERKFNSSTLDFIEENAKKLYANEVGEAVFKTEESVVVEKFNFIEALGRFVIEDNKGIQGVGIIVEK